ncbi:MAG: DUF2062 domain-containing protein [Candidatus Omnitrophota bacterium]|jgi:uncharacterized protein (DUF2062 family)
MSKRAIFRRVSRLAKVIYLKLFRINDSPLKISLGFGLGVFVGVMPSIGPVIALLFAFLFRVNRAGALLGSLLFNTWVGFLVLLPAVKIGSAVMGLNYRNVYEGWKAFIKSFNPGKLFQASVYDVLLPIVVGYLIISLFLAVLATIIVYLIARKIKNRKSHREFTDRAV